MSGFILLLLAALFGCAVLVRRHAQRAPITPTVTPAQGENLRPVDAWQQSIKVAPVAEMDWRERLRREEIRQRPQEGRN